jgi:hypothetical protein
MARRAWLATLVLGFALAVLTTRAHFLGFTVVLLSAIRTWRCWLRVSLERTDSEEHDRRQEEIDEAYRRWSTRLEDRCQRPLGIPVGWSCFLRAGGHQFSRLVAACSPGGRG